MTREGIWCGFRRTFAALHRLLGDSLGRGLRESWNRPQFWLAASLVMGGAMLRLAPHPENFTPIAAIALFGGAHFHGKGWPFGMPLLAMAISDLIVEALGGTGFHLLTPVVYGAFAVIVPLGFLLRRRNRVAPLAAAVFGGALLFFLVTNFGVWALLPTYPGTFEGLIACYLAGLGYFGHTLAGTAFYSAVLFGAFALAARRMPPLAAGRSA